MNVEHITRIKCACGTIVEVESRVICNLSGGYLPSCNPEIDFDPPKGWLGGFENRPYICPECVKKEYG